MLQLAPTLNHRTYNIGGGRPTTNAELAAAITALVPTARTNLLEGRDPIAHDLHLDTTRLRADTGYEPEYDIKQGVGEYLDWLRAGNPR